MMRMKKSVALLVCMVMFGMTGLVGCNQSGNKQDELKQTEETGNKTVSEDKTGDNAEQKDPDKQEEVSKAPASLEEEVKSGVLTGIVAYEPLANGVSILKDGKIGHISKEGELILPCLYEGIKEVGGFYAVKKDGKWGLTTYKGEEVLSCRYDEISRFSEGLADVKKDEKWGYINEKFEEVIPCQYDGAQAFSEGFAVVEKGDKQGVINTKGELVVDFLYHTIYEFEGDSTWVLEPEDGSLERIGMLYNNGEDIIFLPYTDITRVNDGFATVRDEEARLYGLINKKGETILECEYNDIYVQEDALILVCKDGRWGAFDKTGEQVLEFVYDWISWSFDESDVAIVEKDGKNGLINKQGKIILNCEYDNIMIYEEGLILLRKNGKYGFADETGEVTACRYDQAYDSSEGMYSVKKDGKYGYVNIAGAEIVPCEYDDWGTFNEGLSCVRKNGKYGYIDKEGNVMIPFSYEKAYGFYEGMAMVVEGGKRGYINKNGELVIAYQYDDGNHFSNGVTSVEKEGKYGYINYKGEEIIPCEFDWVSTIRDKLIRVEKDGKYGYYDFDGNVFVACQYDSLEGLGEDGNVDKLLHGMVRVSKDGKYGYVKEGVEVVPCQYETVSEIKGDTVVVSKDGKYGLVDWNGNVVIECKYDSLKEQQAWGPTDDNSRVEWLEAVIDGKHAVINMQGKEIIAGLEITDEMGLAYSYNRTTGEFVTFKGDVALCFDLEGNIREVKRSNVGERYWDFGDSGYALTEKDRVVMLLDPKGEIIIQWKNLVTMENVENPR